MQAICLSKDTATTLQAPDLSRTLAPACAFFMLPILILVAAQRIRLPHHLMTCQSPATLLAISTQAKVCTFLIIHLFQHRKQVWAARHCMPKGAGASPHSSAALAESCWMPIYQCVLSQHSMVQLSYKHSRSSS